MGFQEYLDTPGIARVAVALDKAREPMTFRQFTEASGFADAYAGKLRDAMSRFGLLRVTWLNKRTQLIELTTYGKKFVQLVYQQGRIIEEATKAVGADPPPPPRESS